MIEILTIREAQNDGLTVCLKPKIPFVITPTLAHEIRQLQNILAEDYYKKPWETIFFVVWYLHAGQIPWKGLDFSFIYNSLIAHQDHKVEHYLDEVFDLLFINYVGLDLPLVNCSIITRPLSGISQDFFYLNHINFVKLKPQQDIEQNYCNLSVCDMIKNQCFPDNIYSKNQVYGFNKMDLSMIQNIFAQIEYKPISAEEQISIKIVFDDLKNETIHEIYELATNNMKFLERLASRQGAEHSLHRLVRN